MRKILAVFVFTLALTASQTAFASDSSVCAGSNDDLAIPACGRIIAKKGTSKADRVRAYYNRAISLNSKGQTDEAIKDYGQAIALDPTYTSAYTNRCSAYRRLERYDEALPDCDKALTLNPSSDTAHYNRGNVYRRLKQPEKAIVDLTRAIELNSKDADYFFFRAMSYNDNGQLDEAIADYQKTVELDPNYDTAYYNRGNIYRQKKMPDKAIEDFTKALAIKTSDADYFFYRALTYQNNGQLDEAIADYDKALQLTPTDFTTLLNRGLAHKKKGEATLAANEEDKAKIEFDLAVADYDKALAVKPDASAFNSRGNVYYARDDYDRAIADYTSAIALDPTYIDSYYNRGASYSEKGDYQSAITDLDKAIELRPDDAGAFDVRARAYGKKGETARAIADYRSALALSPDDATAKKGIAEAIGAQPPAASDTATASAAGSDTPKQVTATTVDPSKSGESGAALTPSARRVALVIGNSAYRSVARLPNPANDAELIGNALRKAGIDDVTVAIDLDRAGMVSTLRAFARKADNSDWAMVYYAGHGMEMEGKNYLIPVDASLETDRDIPDETLSLDRVLSAVSGARQLKLVILDACRNNPFSSQMKLTVASRAVTRGLSRVEPVDATLVVYSAKEGTTAEDGDGGNSVFAASISKRIVEPGVEINKVFRLVTRDVLTETGNRQQPFVYGSLPPDDFILVPAK